MIRINGTYYSVTIDLEALTVRCFDHFEFDESESFDTLDNLAHNLCAFLQPNNGFDAEIIIAGLAGFGDAAALLRLQEACEKVLSDVNQNGRPFLDDIEAARYNSAWHLCFSCRRRRIEISPMAKETPEQIAAIFGRDQGGENG